MGSNAAKPKHLHNLNFDVAARLPDSPTASLIDGLTALLEAATSFTAYSSVRFTKGPAKIRCLATGVSVNDLPRHSQANSVKVLKGMVEKVWLIFMVI